MKSSQTWADAHIQSILDLTPTVREFSIRPTGGALAHTPGSHLQLEVLAGGRPQVRSYSLVGPSDDEAYRIAVKRLDDGRGGSRAMWQLAPGDRLRISEPQNHFPLSWDAPAYLLVAGGIGVTPMVGMAQALAARKAPVRMRYAARSVDELAYATVLAACLGDALQPAVGRRIDFASEVAALPPRAQMYVCGPVALLDAARQAWEAAGRLAQDMRFETFGSSGHLAARAFQVSVPRHQLELTVPADVSLLDALNGAGIEVLADCVRGECGLCALDVLALEGQIDHRDVFLSPHEKQANRRICACVSRVAGSITLDTAWRAAAR